MNFIHNKLKGRIIEILGSNQAFIQKMKISNASFYGKINGEKEFTDEEIYKACKILQINPTDVYEYFFKTE